MPNLHIYCDAHFTAGALALLQSGVAPHELVLPGSKGASVLGVAPADPAMLQAEIAFGQPDAAGVLQAKGLRWLQLTSAGFTRYDTAEFRTAAQAQGLIVTNSSSVFAEPCAEHVFSFMMANARKLPEALGRQCANDSPEWAELRNASCLLGQRVVILGYGTIAARLIELLAPFHMTITAMRRQPRGDEGVAIVTPENLPAALATADHVVNIMPENADSRGFISAARLAQMKPGAIFYNIGRGATVDQAALVDSLHSGHLGAAWLDVTDPEPLPENHPLLSAPRCHITPHTAGGRIYEAEILVRHFLENLKRFARGEPLRDRVI